MKTYITKEEIEADMSPVAIESIQELTEKTIKGFKKTGLMSPELCLIAINILDTYSDNAKTIIKGMKNLDTLLADADNLLKELNS